MSTVGILGGGQLARMMAIAGAPLGLRFLLLDNVADACAGQCAPMLVGDYRDQEILARFAQQVDVATFDFENVPAESAQWLSKKIAVFPNPNALAISQDRLAEKTLFQSLNIGVPAFAEVNNLASLQSAIVAIGLPCILKTRRLGYDGKGQFRIKTPEDIAAAWQALGAQAQTVGLILEAFVAFDREISVLAVRARDGQFQHWALTENWHENGVLSASLAPAIDTDFFATNAIAHAQKIAEALDYVGVFALELFVCGTQLLANEMAPRVHNSGHWTIEGAETSQFQNHLRAVLGLPLGSTRSIGLSCMLNWIGRMPAPQSVLQEAGGHWHDYGKSPRAGRKVGHATVREANADALAKSLMRVSTALQRVAQVAPVLERLQKCDNRE